MHVSELFDPDLLPQYIDRGLISANRHPTSALTIYNYTPKAQATRAWDDVTRTCRGLILRDNGDIVARPFPKFFNYSENDQYDEVITPDTEVEAFDKLDGSLGIVYWDDQDNPQVATRGSFTSPMAIHASEIIKNLLIPNFSNITMMVEIIYPENQIVLDYKGMDDLVLLGGIRIDSGIFMDPVQVFTEIRGVYPEGGFRYLAQDYAEIKTVQDALNNLNRTNREGFVLHTMAGTMVKVKQDDYLYLHKLVFQTSKRTIWYSFAKEALESVNPDSGAMKRLTAHMDSINNAMSIGEMRKNLIDRFPSNIADAGVAYIESLYERYDSDMRSYIEAVEQARSAEITDRSGLYEFVSSLGVGKSAGIITDIVQAENAGDKETSMNMYDRLSISVVYRMRPGKGERLTDSLTEEDE